MKNWAIGLGLSLIFTSGRLMGGPINTDTALPVHKGGLIVREQARYLRATDDATALDREVEVWAIPTVLVYGVAENFALMGAMPYLDKSLELNSEEGRIERETNGVGDLTFLLRQQLIHRDFPGKTIRTQVLGGVEFPTGQDDERDKFGLLPPDLQLGSGSWDGIFAVVLSYQTLSWELDFDLNYKLNTEANDFEFGDRFGHNASFSHRLFPRVLPDTGVPSFLYAVLELNGSWSDRSQGGGIDVQDSGGYTLLISPGLQYVMRNLILEAAVQIPIIQDLNGGQVELDYIAALGFRIQI